MNGHETSFGTIFLDPDESQAMRKRLTKDYEINKVKHIEANLTSDDVFMDIGACRGYFSLIASRTGAEVHAFEPDMANQEALYQTMLANKYAFALHYYALWNENQVRNLYKTGEGSGHNSLISSSEISDVVACRTLDSGLNVHYPAPTVLKIDTEGAEFEVLQGATESLKTVHTVLLDLHGRENEKVMALLRGKRIIR